MQQFDRRITEPKADATFLQVSLPFERRQKARQRVTLDSGEDVALVVPRGTILRDGDCLESGAGVRVRVCAAPEPVSIVKGDSPQALARAAYHLGNRHVWVQVGDGWLAYLADHVLDDLVRGLGLVPVAIEAAFEPEAGAYSGDTAARVSEHSHTHHDGVGLDAGGHGHTH